MPLIGFKKQFASRIIAGSKRSTIRARRKDGKDPKPKDTLFLYTGLRTKACQKLMETKCKSVDPIAISYMGEISVNGKHLTPSQILELARRDGFDDTVQFLAFFKTTHGLPFDGLLIKWDPQGESV